MNLKYLKEAVYEANMEIPKQKLAIYTFGNVSAIDRTEAVIAIKTMSSIFNSEYGIPLGFIAMTPSVRSIAETLPKV